MPIRIAIADDHPLARRGLCQYLEDEDDLQVIVDVPSGAELLSGIENADPAPDIALVDVRMPGMDGIETIRQLRRRFPAVRLVMLSAFGDPQLLTDALRAGAVGYLLKTREPDFILRAIRLVHEGGLIIDPALVPSSFSGWAGDFDRREAEPLTRREREILSQLPAGRTNREIASAMCLSPDTVKGHLDRIFRKLGARDRTAAVAEGFRRKLIE
jgi:DNA-binding NarL/FixJ family response regulator